MAGFKKYKQLKKQYGEEWILLEDSFDYLWTFEDDAEKLSEELGMEVKYNNNGRAVLKIKRDKLDEERYALIGINGSDDEFFLRYVVYEEEEAEPDLYPATTWYVAEIESQDEIRIKRPQPRASTTENTPSRKRSRLPMQSEKAALHTKKRTTVSNSFGGKILIWHFWKSGVTSLILTHQRRFTSTPAKTTLLKTI